MNLSEKFTQCEKLFLEAAYDAFLIDEALSLSAELFNGNAAQLYTFDKYGNLLSSRHLGFTDDCAKRELDYLDINPRVKAAGPSKEGEILYDYKFISQDEINLDATYQDLIKPNDIDWFAGTKLIQNQNCTVLFGVFRNAEAEHFSQDELNQFKWLSDRIAGSISTALHIDEIKWKSKFAALESTTGSMAAISVSGTIIEMSQDFQPLLKKYNIGVLSAQSALKIKDPVIDNFLKITLPKFNRNMVSLDTTPIKNAGRMIKSKSGEWLELQLYPIPMVSRWAHSGAVALVSLEELKDIKSQPKELHDLFSLTSAESDIAVLLANGKSLKDVAGIRQVSYETVRWQVKRILQKTECRNQIELAILINRLLR